jgi:hypothetical protein
MDWSLKLEGITAPSVADVHIINSKTRCCSQFRQKRKTFVATTAIAGLGVDNAAVASCHHTGLPVLLLGAMIGRQRIKLVTGVGGEYVGKSTSADNGSRGPCKLA